VLNKTRRTLPIEIAWVFARESGEGTEFPIDGAVEMTGIVGLKPRPSTGSGTPSRTAFSVL